MVMQLIQRTLFALAVGLIVLFLLRSMAFEQTDDPWPLRHVWEAGGIAFVCAMTIGFLLNLPTRHR